MNNVGDLDQGGGCSAETNGKRLCILNVEARGLVTGLSVRCGKKRSH